MANIQRIEVCGTKIHGTKAHDFRNDIVENADIYDRMPYTSHPFAQTHPARIGAIASLFGLSPVPMRRARILEIGCASGGNLIPIAARFPEAQCVGLDISPVQVASGRERCERLNLTNIEIQCISITDFEAEPQSFDYIICHGVFSWVDAPVREAILAQIGRLLSRNGVADVSYNVLPGWRMRQALRDAMILHAGHNDDPNHRVVRARWILNFLKEHTKTGSVWGQMFRHEAEHLSRLPDDYVLHEFLENTNEPMTFTAFAEQARHHGLGYLGDADIAMMVPENLDAGTALALREMCAEQVMPVEQYMDIVTGRTFRQSLLVRSENEMHISRVLNTSCINKLHLVANRDLFKTQNLDKTITFFDSAGRSLTTPHPVVIAALEILLARLPGSVMVEDIVELKYLDNRGLIMDALAKMLQVGLLHLSTEQISCVTEISDKPEVSIMTRSDAAVMQIVVNERHEPVTLGLIAKIITPYLDGKHDKAALYKIVYEAIMDGQLVFQNDGIVIASSAMLSKEIIFHTDTVLNELCSAGLLVH